VFKPLDDTLFSVLDDQTVYDLLEHVGFDAKLIQPNPFVSSDPKDGLLTQHDEEEFIEFIRFYERELYRFSQDDPSTEYYIAPVVPTELSKVVSDKDYAPPTIEDDGVYVDRDLWFYLVYLMRNGEHPLVHGDQGSGKTTIISWLADAFGYNLTKVDMGSTVDPVAVLLGQPVLREGSSKFVLSRLAQAIKESKNTPTAILFDEIARASPMANNMILSLTDERRELYIDMAEQEEDRILKLSKDALIFSSANIGYKFVGTNTLDPAIEDRFTLVHLDYPPAKAEMDLLKARCKGIDEKDADKIITIANISREAVKSDQIKSAISVRGTIKMGQRVAFGYSLKQTLSNYVAAYMQEDYDVLQEEFEKILKAGGQSIFKRS